MHVEMRAHIVWICVDTIHPLRVEHRRATLYSVNCIPFGQQQPSKVGAVLACHSGDKRGFHVVGNIIGDHSQVNGTSSLIFLAFPHSADNLNCLVCASPPPSSAS